MILDNLFVAARRIALFLGVAAWSAFACARGSPLSKSESRAQNGFRTAIFINVTGSRHVVEKGDDVLASGTNVPFEVVAALSVLLPGAPSCPDGSHLAIVRKGHREVRDSWYRAIS